MKVKTLLKPLTILNRQYSLDRLLQQNEIILACADDFEQADCDRHLAAAEKQLVALAGTKKLQKRIFNVILESVQNIVRHGVASSNILKVGRPMLILGKEQGIPYVLTANPVEQYKVALLKERIDQVNATGNDKLKKLYRETLGSGEFNDAGGANLGFIEMARKSGGQLQYGFDRIDDDHAYFILKVNVDGDS